MRYFNEPSENEENPCYPCGICAKEVEQEHKAIQCDTCNFWNHITCENIDNNTYEALILSNDSDPHYCTICENVLLQLPQSPTEVHPIPTELCESPEKVYHCGSCSKKVGKRHKAVQCDLCDKWNHIKCDGIDNKTYEALKKSNELEKYFCKICKENTFAFQKLSDDEFFTSIVKNINISAYLQHQCSNLFLMISAVTTVKTHLP